MPQCSSCAPIGRPDRLQMAICLASSRLLRRVHRRIEAAAAEFGKTDGPTPPHTSFRPIRSVPLLYLENR
ncbi:hypothetical protein [Chitinimonas koreensis]|uniref:hypothetical protein n=1 Tax=Chitinimonas koreensis TaxID=356302 RepID=UPI00040D0846|nr:hypothetical protein [Chitinimonas koreensis]QNM96483.1 hypothetical protein H9L41_22365 [Chitinimonas koreensis]